MKTRLVATLLSCLLLGAALQAQARPEHRQDDLEVEVLNDNGRELRQYPLRDKGGRVTQRAYLEARAGENYAIRVSNHSAERIGVVIAVDGRNIISGKKSHLRPQERMYVLRPYQSAVYEGWRTSRNRINRFYFTETEDSYADAFDDRSAMGVIAVAAYREQARRPRHTDTPYEQRSGRRPNSASSMAEDADQPGTGFGDSEWSPSVRVKFKPRHKPFAKQFIKYEWRKTLCRKGIIDCRRHQPPRNRFWPEERDGGFAPPPPGREYPWRERHGWD